MSTAIHVIGAGLAGCEAAWQLAQRGIRVLLHEMKPQKKTPAHKSDSFAELVCSNSLRADRIWSAAGLLKEEMRQLGSLVIWSADKTRVPAGGALAVNRDDFSAYITEAVQTHPEIEIVHGEAGSLDALCGQTVIVASGPLTSEKLAGEIAKLTGEEYLHFYDAAAPIVTAESVDMECAFMGARYGRGGDDYINCPMTKEEYDAFYGALINAECAEIRGFEQGMVFEGCMPVESMAQRGEKTLLFGPLKPKGLTDPKTGRMPYAVVQLRKENREGSLLNLVGFQTHLKFPEQKRVFSMIPALRDAEFVRYGVMHKNTFLNAPKLLDMYYRLRGRESIRFAGQITGVEGYVESAASGLVCGLCAANEARGKPLPVFTSRTALGALSLHVSGAETKDYQPMNINFGIIEEAGQRIRGKEAKNTFIAERALDEVKRLKQEYFE
ncbi:MAG: methylenetetrahydrofolate--tRNA-(uracil(54)-C(5))-methyltransferase (FADH(2)-oxidizing) TrmFO [Christensenellaceae bacterium]|jgi:methylenetetrahydrofolate--tRNA-(uracil-5-)-methyltransferase